MATCSCFAFNSLVCIFGCSRVATRCSKVGKMNVERSENETFYGHYFLSPIISLRLRIKIEFINAIKIIFTIIIGSLHFLCRETEIFPHRLDHEISINLRTFPKSLATSHFRVKIIFPAYIHSFINITAGERIARAVKEMPEWKFASQTGFGLGLRRIWTCFLHAFNVSDSLKLCIRTAYKQIDVLLN